MFTFNETKHGSECQFSTNFQTKLIAFAFYDHCYNVLFPPHTGKVMFSQLSATLLGDEAGNSRVPPSPGREGTPPYSSGLIRQEGSMEGPSRRTEIIRQQRGRDWWKETPPFPLTRTALSWQESLELPLKKIPPTGPG